MSLLLLFNGRLGAPGPPVIIQTFPMGDHGIAAVVSMDGRVLIESNEALAATLGLGGRAIRGGRAIIVEDDGSASIAGPSIRTGIE